MRSPILRSLLLLLLLSSRLPATEVTQSFKSSAFQNNGTFSNYMLSLENVAYTRKQTQIAQAKAEAATATAVNAWLTIDSDGSITLASGASDMGQGSFSGLAQILCEDLDRKSTRLNSSH